MQKRILGTTGMEVPPLTIGSNVFGWTVDETTSHLLLDNFMEQGINFIDTANTYSSWVPGNKGGESETIIGNWIKQRGNRIEVIIATKCGSEMNGEKGLTKKLILQWVNESLERLQTDYIDLYQAHYPDPGTPILETLEAFDQLIKEGKVRAIGASNYTHEQLNEALLVSKETGLASYATLQPLYNLYDRAPYETALQPVCTENNIAVISYYALASGFLTGKYRSESDLDKSKRGGGIKKYLNLRGLKILDALDEVSFFYEVTPAVVALAWLLAKPSITAPIVSATTSQQIADLVKATTLSLDSSTIEMLDKVSADS